MHPAFISLFNGARARPYWRFLLLALIGAVFFLALSPSPPRGVDTGWDKSNHLLAFGTLAFCGHWGWGTRAARYVWLPAGLVLLGGLIELLQLQVPGRSGEWADLLADSFGIVAGLLLAKLSLRLLQVATRPKQ